VTTERFDDYMARCLYDSEAGFYTQHGNAGRGRGDFVTSPEVGPLFGLVLSRALDAWWTELGRPDPFWVVEAGAGRGALAKAVLAASPECGVAGALRYVTVELSPRLRAEQLELLGDSVAICATLDDAAQLAGQSAAGERFTGVILANELLDNLPFRMVSRSADVDGGGWDEVVVIDGIPALADPDEIAGPIARALPDAPAGERLPVCEQAASWVADAVSRLERGRVITIDYGTLTSGELVGRRWLRTYRDHQRGADPFEAPGRCDITCDVPFDQLRPASLLETQAEFLERFGVAELVAEGRRVWAERAHLGDLVAVRARSRVAESAGLLDPDGLGSFLVAHWIVDGSAPAETP